MASHKDSRNFKEICTEFNLRIKRNDAGEPISPTRKRTNPYDHLYDLHNGKIGVHISRESPKKYTFAKKKLVSLGDSRWGHGRQLFCNENTSCQSCRILGMSQEKG